MLDVPDVVIGLPLRELDEIGDSSMEGGVELTGEAREVVDQIVALLGDDILNLPIDFVEFEDEKNRRIRSYRGEESDGQGGFGVFDVQHYLKVCSYNDEHRILGNRLSELDLTGDLEVIIQSQLAIKLREEFRRREVQCVVGA